MRHKRCALPQKYKFIPVNFSRFFKFGGLFGTQGEVDAQKKSLWEESCFFATWHVKLSRGVGWYVCCVQFGAPLTRQTTYSEWTSELPTIFRSLPNGGKRRGLKKLQGKVSTALQWARTTLRSDGIKSKFHRTEVQSFVSAQLSF